MLDSNGNAVEMTAHPQINGPWDMNVFDENSKQPVLFVTNVLVEQSLEAERWSRRIPLPVKGCSSFAFLNSISPRGRSDSLISARVATTPLSS